MPYTSEYNQLAYYLDNLGTLLGYERNESETLQAYKTRLLRLARKKNSPQQVNLNEFTHIQLEGYTYALGKSIYPYRILIDYADIYVYTSSVLTTTIDLNQSYSDVVTALTPYVDFIYTNATYDDNNASFTVPFDNRKFEQKRLLESKLNILEPMVLEIILDTERHLTAVALFDDLAPWTYYLDNEDGLLYSYFDIKASINYAYLSEDVVLKQAPALFFDSNALDISFTNDLGEIEIANDLCIELLNFQNEEASRIWR